MVDPTFFQIEFDTIRLKYIHKGILSKGHDLFSDFQCLNHYYEDSSNGTPYFLQTYQNLPQDLYYKKIDR